MVSIITITYNGLSDTRRLLDSIPAGDDSLEVIVVDNGSREDEASVLQKLYPHIRALRLPSNLGFAGGNNAGLGIARGRLIYFVNNDAVFRPFDISALIRQLDADPCCGIVCPKILNADGSVQWAGFTPLTAITLRNATLGRGEPDDGRWDTPHPTPYAHGAAMMVRREAIEKAGMMSERFFLYYEELDWSERIRRAGYTIHYCPDSRIYHLESQATGQDSPLKTYYSTRGRLLFARRNLPPARRAAACAYLATVVATRDTLRALLRRRRDLATATIKGTVAGLWEIKN